MFCDGEASFVFASVSVSPPEYEASEYTGTLVERTCVAGAVLSVPWEMYSDLEIDSVVTVSVGNVDASASFDTDLELE